MDYTHKGITIKVNKEGKFEATFAGKPVLAPSLDAMKSRIDKTDKLEFTPFDAVDTEEGYGDEKWKMLKYKVVGLAVRNRATKYHQQELGFKGDDGRVRDKAIAATPENVALVKSVIEHRNESLRIEKQRNKELKALRDSIAYMRPEREQ